MAESEKIKKEGELCKIAGWGFLPAAYNPWGGQGPGAKHLLWEILKRATADMEGWAKTQRRMEIQESLSLALARGVAEQLSLRFKTSPF